MTFHLLQTARGCPPAARQRAAVEALGDTAAWLIATLRTWRQRIRERGELASLGDRMLGDIGLTRADAEFLSNKPFWKE